jgi:2-polyprenyl-3-methyl-5-hydroxy-6-metoxy-1,4-benzoquinol methylase
MDADETDPPLPADPQEAHALNRASYNAVAAEWDAARSVLQTREKPFLDALLDGVDPPGEVLDLGCGTGRPIAAEVLARGHQVTGVDQAEALLAIARSRCPSATWIQSAIESFVAPGVFHAIVCWDALFHIDRSLHPGLFERMAGMLVPGGRLMLTAGGSEHPAFTDTMFGRRFFYDSHPPAAVEAMLGAAGFQPVLAAYLDRPTGGRDKGRYALVVRKR